MFTRLIFWFKNLFEKDEDEFAQPDYEEIRKSPARASKKDFASQTKSPARTYTKKQETKSSRQDRKNDKGVNLERALNPDTDLPPNVTVPTKDALLKQIKANIFFLDQLQELLEQNTRYLSYQKKVLSMQKNSHNSLKIITRLRVDAPYYNSTMEMIFRHTNAITQILEVST